LLAVFLLYALHLSAEPIQQSAGEHDLPDGRKSHQRFADCGKEVSRKRDRLPPLQFVRKRSGKSLHDVLRGFGKAVHQPDDTAAGVERLRQEDGKNRLEHLRRNVGEQAGECEKEGGS